MIDETDIQQILKKDGFELSDDEFQLLLEVVKSQINQGLDVPIEPVSFTQVENGFNDDKLLVDMFPIDEIHSLKIGDSILIEDEDYNIDYDDGILYFNRTYNGFLRLEYSAGSNFNCIFLKQTYFIFIFFFILFKHVLILF